MATPGIYSNIFYKHLPPMKLAVDILNDNIMVRKYIAGRGVSSEVESKIPMGFCDSKFYKHLNMAESSPFYTSSGYHRFNNYIVFPMYDRQYTLTGYAGRYWGDAKKDSHPKYMRSERLAGRALFPYHILRGSGTLYLVEGYFDALVLVSHGRDAIAVGTGGLSPEDMSMLIDRYSEINVVLDGDQAGHKATVRWAIEYPWLGIITLPDGKDPDEFLLEHGRLPHPKKAYLWIMEQDDPEKMMHALLNMDYKHRMEALRYYGRRNRRRVMG